MKERELVAIMTAIIYAGPGASSGFGVAECLSKALEILAEWDRRLAGEKKE